MKKPLLVIITGLGLLCTVISLLVLIWYLTVFLDEPGRNYPLNLGSYLTAGHTKIDPQTLLSSLEQGDLDIFQLEAGLPDDSSSPAIVVEWTQADFLRIAEAIQQVVWKESMNDWNLYRMDYMAPCKDKLIGLFHAEFYYFQEIQVNGESLYSYREILIDPRYEYIAWGGDTLYDKPATGWKSIDLNEIAIPAEKAMIEAEARGGKELRLSAKNQCNILITMIPEFFQRFDWKVDYSAGFDVLPEPQEFWIPSK